MDLEESIIFDKLTGVLPIRSAETARNDQPESSNVQDNASATLEVMCQTQKDDASVALDIMRQTQNNYAFRILHSHRKILGHLIIFCKRIVRKCLKWYLEPVCFQQTDFNRATVLAVEVLLEKQKAQQAEIESLKTQLEALQH